MSQEIYKCPKCDKGEIVEIANSHGKLECNFCNFSSFKSLFIKGVLIK